MEKLNILMLKEREEQEIGVSNRLWFHVARHCESFSAHPCTPVPDRHIFCWLYKIC